MTENKQFILTEQFVTLQGITFVKEDDNAYKDTYYTVGEAVDLLNDYAYDNKQLIKENCEYKRFASKDQDLLAEFHTEIEQLKKENEQLKSELSRYEEVNRLDIWKSSYSSEDALITELQDKCDKKQEHIVVLENKIRRMREAIHKLEWLATHRNGELIRENEQLRKSNKFLSDMRDVIDIVDENKQLKQFIKELTTKGTGRIDLASGYSYNVSAVLTDYRGDVE